MNEPSLDTQALDLLRSKPDLLDKSELDRLISEGRRLVDLLADARLSGTLSDHQLLEKKQLIHMLLDWLKQARIARAR